MSLPNDFEISQSANSPMPAGMDVWERRALDQGLFEAVAKNDFYDARRLIARGANPNAQQASGQTPLTYAVARELLAFASILLPASKINERLADGRLTIEVILAASIGYDRSRGANRFLTFFLPKIMALVDAQATNHNGRAAAHFLALYRDDSLATLSAFADASPQSVWHLEDLQGNTPLLVALQEKRFPQAVAILPLSNPWSKNHAGACALDLAEHASPSRNVDFAGPWNACVERFELAKIAQHSSTQSAAPKPRRI